MILTLDKHLDIGWTGHASYEPGVDTPLLPCPFCGSASVQVTNLRTPFYEVVCGECQARVRDHDAVGETYDRESEGSVRVAHAVSFVRAIARWNRRLVGAFVPVAPPTEADVLARLQERGEQIVYWLAMVGANGIPVLVHAKAFNGQAWGGCEAVGILHAPIADVVARLNGRSWHRWNGATR